MNDYCKIWDHLYRMAYVSVVVLTEISTRGLIQDIFQGVHMESDYQK